MQSGKGARVLADVASRDDPEDLFELIDVIGHGAFGTVCSCMNKKTLELVAVKFIPIENREDTGKLQKEIDIMRKIPPAPEIVKYHGCYIKDDMLLIVMEYCDGGSMMDILRLCKKKLNEDQIAAASAAVVRGLEHLHKVAKIIHRDIKAANILLSSKGEAKLADFGVSAQLATSTQRQKTVIGSPFWMAPEVIDQADSDTSTGYGSASDIWSLGITAIEMAETKPPHYELMPIRAILKIPIDPPPTLKQPQLWSPEFNDFLAICLKKNPDERPTATQLLKHPFIQRGIRQRHILAELVDECMPALIQARLEQQTASDEEGDSVSSRERSDSGSEPDWFTLQKGATFTCNSNTMKAEVLQEGKNGGKS